MEEVRLIDANALHKRIEMNLLAAIRSLLKNAAIRMP